MASQTKSGGPSKARGLKEHREKMARRQAKHTEKRLQRERIVFGVKAFAVIMAVLVAIAGVYVAFFANHIVFIDGSSPDQLKQVFLSGEAWVVGCAEGNDAQAPKALKDASSLLHNNYINVGVINCSAPLPSGKTVLKRFNLQRIKANPTIMVVANGKKPIQIMPSYLKTSKLLTSFAISKTKVRENGLLLRASVFIAMLAHVVGIRLYGALKA
eukprot:TRINITY_DN12298_c7_g1_i5.p1 TRINITY_DN12298_c7_g1~~TRINITY_DN12298_c7_g1_i5.p1  ORF type:complete len:214 (+),score=41.44 TRINITY_DN12298_c7_g1_i5:415-1056(+)